MNYPASYDFLGAADGADDATNQIAQGSPRPARGHPYRPRRLFPRERRWWTSSWASSHWGAKVGDVGSAPPMPAKAWPGEVAAIAVFGNPSTK